MYSRSFKVFIFLLLFSLIVCQVFPQANEDPFSLMNARISALGGYHAAYSEDYTAIFTNPAGIKYVPFEWLVAEMAIGLKGPVFDIATAIINVANTGADPLTDPGLNAMLHNLNTGITIVGPISFAMLIDGFSVGIFSWTEIEFKTIVMDIGRFYRQNLVVTGGYTFRIPLPPEAGTLDIGAQLKVLGRGTVEGISTRLAFLSSLYFDPSAFIMADPLTMSLGGGLDAGIMYNIADILTVGIVGRDVFSATYQMIFPSMMDMLSNFTFTNQMGYVPADLSAGIKVTPPLGIIGRVISKLDIYIDYQDILGFATHPATDKHWFLHLSAGMEVSLLEILHLRAGFAEGLFAGGFGLDLTILKMNVSMFGTEESLCPSLNPQYNVMIDFAFDY
ncbi:MAG: hypothetical protein JW969_08565 [Spirochaetales bacterium]|nr:hypothetical protein [Spirochaetales bacterium]